MQVSNLAELAGSTAASTAKATTAADLGQQDFLRMLIAQLENQDPLNPQNATEFSSQLAQFSSLEQEVAMRSALEQISTVLTAGDKSTAIDLIGRDVVASSSQFELSAGASTLRFELANASDTTVVEVRDALGGLVYSADLGPRGSGNGEFQWDGTGRSGIPVPDGVYSFEVLASADLLPVSTTPLIQGRVSGADVSGGNPVLRIGNVVIPLSSVQEVRGSTPKPGTSL